MRCRSADSDPQDYFPRKPWARTPNARPVNWDVEFLGITRLLHLKIRKNAETFALSGSQTTKGDSMKKAL